MSNYDEALDSEKRTMNLFIKSSFYPKQATAPAQMNPDMEAVLRKIQKNPELTQQILQALLLSAVQAQTQLFRVSWKFSRKKYQIQNDAKRMIIYTHPIQLYKGS